MKKMREREEARGSKKKNEGLDEAIMDSMKGDTVKTSFER